MLGAGTRCDYSRLLVPGRREAAVAGWRGGGRSSMPLTLPCHAFDLAVDTTISYQWRLAVVVHDVTGLGLGVGVFRAKALQGLWFWPTMVMSLVAHSSLETLS